MDIDIEDRHAPAGPGEDLGGKCGIVDVAEARRDIAGGMMARWPAERIGDGLALQHQGRAMRSRGRTRLRRRPGLIHDRAGTIAQMIAALADDRVGVAYGCEARASERVNIGGGIFRGIGQTVPALPQRIHEGEIACIMDERQCLFADRRWCGHGASRELHPFEQHVDALRGFRYRLALTRDDEARWIVQTLYVVEDSDHDLP